MGINKKVAVIGRGTAGCFSAMKLSATENLDVDLYYDSTIPVQSVGEGSTLRLPQML